MTARTSVADDRMCHPVSRRRLARFVASKEKAESPLAGGNNLAAAAPAAAEEGGKGVVRPSLTRSLSDEWFTFLPTSLYIFIPSFLSLHGDN